VASINEEAYGLCVHRPYAIFDLGKYYIIFILQSECICMFVCLFVA